jgi:hypothetical protein
MKKIYFSGLISCGLLLAAAQTMGQFEQNGEPITANTNTSTSLLAYPENQNIIVLRWFAGSNEQLIDHYTIEKSTDSSYFNPMHEVVARGTVGGSGSLDSAAYQDEDSYPTSPVNYYRLVTVMKDGSSIYSSVVRADVNSRHTPVLKPTVLHMDATLRLDDFHEQPLQINFYTASGAIIASYMVNSTAFNVNSGTWPKGIVFYRIADENQALIGAGKILVQ